MTDFKQPARVKASADEWVKLRKQKLGACRVCGESLALGLAVVPNYHWNASNLESSLHHLVSKSLGGDDVAANLVPLCGSGTTGCHGEVEAHSEFHGRVLVQNLSAAERAYVARKKDAGYLERRYGVTREAA